VCDSVDWIELNQDLFQWWGLENTVNIIRALQGEGNFLTKKATVNVSNRILFHEIRSNSTIWKYIPQ
jgi:predicted transcriptional regulator YheO